MNEIVSRDNEILKGLKRIADDQTKTNEQVSKIITNLMGEKLDFPNDDTTLNRTVALLSPEERKKIQDKVSSALDNGTITGEIKVQIGGVLQPTIMKKSDIIKGKLVYLSNQ